MFRLSAMIPVLTFAFLLYLSVFSAISMASDSTETTVATTMLPHAEIPSLGSDTPYALKPFVGFGGSIGRGQYNPNDDTFMGSPVQMRAMWSYDFRAGSYYDTIGTAVYLSYFNTKGKGHHHGVSYETIQNAMYVAANFNILTRHTYLIVGVGRLFQDASLSHMLGVGINIPFATSASLQMEYINYVDIFSNVSTYQSDTRNVFRMGITYFPSIPIKKL